MPDCSREQFLENKIPTRKILNIITNTVKHNAENQTLQSEILEGLLQAPQKLAKNIKNAYNIFPIGYLATQPADLNTEKRKRTKFMKELRVGEECQLRC
jgi:hypothetical protein